MLVSKILRCSLPITVPSLLQGNHCFLWLWSLFCLILKSVKMNSQTMYYFVASLYICLLVHPYCTMYLQFIYCHCLMSLLNSILLLHIYLSNLMLMNIWLMSKFWILQIICCYSWGHILSTYVCLSVQYKPKSGNAES